MTTTRLCRRLLLVAMLARAGQAWAQASLLTLYTVTDGNPIGLSNVRGAFVGATAEVGVGANCGTLFELQPPGSPSVHG